VWRFAPAVLVVVLVNAAKADAVSIDPMQVPAGTYQINKPHTQVMFSILHLGLTDFYGRFDRVSGTLEFDPKHFEQSRVSVAIDMTSADTPSNELNNELKSPNVFNAAVYPDATFKSASVKKTGRNTGVITGNLTLRGITKPVTLNAVFNGGMVNPLTGLYSLGFHASGKIKRTDFGISGMPWEPIVGDDVTLTIEAMFETAGKGK